MPAVCFRRPVLWAVAASLSTLGAHPVLASIEVQTSFVGNPGVPADTTGYGLVDHSFSMATYDVTALQFSTFLNAVAADDPYQIYNTAMAGTTQGDPGIMRTGISGSYVYNVAPGRLNRPVTEVTYWDATRFVNWLANGQPTGPEGAGTTETGTYTLTEGGIDRNAVPRNPGSTWSLPSENEWYKAAYYSPIRNATSGGYWNYATQSDSISTTQANYAVGPPADSTDVGAYPYPSYYTHLV